MAAAVDEAVAVVEGTVAVAIKQMEGKMALGRKTRVISNVSSAICMDTMPTSVQERIRKRKKHTMSKQWNMSLLCCLLNQ